jgi:Arc/MetJ-type ribon-helix-helix transcriptional regulator
MKVSVSLPEGDVQFLDEYSRKSGLESRSAVLQKAVRLLRTAELGQAYAAAWDEWFESGEEDAWDGASGDGIGHR